MASIAILIATPKGQRLIAAYSEREAALMAESIVRQLGPDALPAPFWVQCADPAITRRLMAYLSDLQAELIRLPIG